MLTLLDTSILLFVVIAIAAIMRMVINELFLQEPPIGTHATELRRVELELRALEHKAHSGGHSASDSEAYSQLIQLRNQLSGVKPVVAQSYHREHPVAARLA